MQRWRISNISHRRGRPPVSRHRAMHSWEPLGTVFRPSGQREALILRQQGLSEPVQRAPDKCLVTEHSDVTNNCCPLVSRWRCSSATSMADTSRTARVRFPREVMSSPSSAPSRLFWGQNLRPSCLNLRFHDAVYFGKDAACKRRVPCCCPRHHESRHFDAQLFRASPQTRQSRPSTATGCTESSATRPPARATGPAGTGRPRSSSASAGCSTTRTRTPATGPTTSRAARSTVRPVTHSSRAPARHGLCIRIFFICNHSANAVTACRRELTGTLLYLLRSESSRD
jgi:hypothetical protein